MSSFILDIRGQLNNIRLAESKALWPLFEAVVRSFKFTNNGNIEILCDGLEMKKIDEDEMALRCLREDKGLPRKIQKTT